MGEKRYCMACGEEDDTTPLERGGKTELICISCGLTLDIVVPDEPGKAGPN